MGTMKVARADHEALVTSQYLVVFGGRDNQNINSIERIKLDGNSDF